MALGRSAGLAYPRVVRLTAAILLPFLLPSAVAAGTALGEARALAEADAQPVAALQGTPVTPEDPYDACLRKLDARPPKPPPKPGTAPGGDWTGPVGLPSLNDDAGNGPLASAARRTADYWRRRPGTTLTTPGGGVSAADLASALDYIATLDSTDPRTLMQALSSRFDAYESLPGPGAKGKVTGYFAPVIPVYERPRPKTVAILKAPGDLRKPYFSAAEIHAGALASRGLELYWTKSADLLDLQIEGSGFGVLPDGSRVSLHYANGNGRKFRGVSGALGDPECRLTPTVLNPFQLAAHLDSLPIEVQRKALSLNPSYVFFTASKGGAPGGSTGISLVGGRSVAVDSAFVPMAAPAVLVSRRPLVDASGTVTGYQDFARLVFTHDKGGAIKGGARVDLYFGEGAAAQAVGNRMNQMGRLFLLVPR